MREGRREERGREDRGREERGREDRGREERGRKEGGRKEERDYITQYLLSLFARNSFVSQMIHKMSETDRHLKRSGLRSATKNQGLLTSSLSTRRFSHVSISELFFCSSLIGASLSEEESEE